MTPHHDPAATGTFDGDGWHGSVYPMTTKKATPARKAKGLEKAMFRLEPQQLSALRREALRRATERASMKPDASEIVREAVAEWLRKHA
jgi:hypothetical protein